VGGSDFLELKKGRFHPIYMHSYMVQIVCPAFRSYGTVLQVSSLEDDKMSMGESFVTERNCYWCN